MLLTIQFVDHPLIALGQALVAVALLRLFFIVRTDGAPLPQLMLGLAVSVWANLAARITAADWFYIIDIVQYWTWFVVIVSSIVQRLHQKRAAAKQASAPVHVPDFFDRWQNQITWAGAIAVGAMLLYGYLSNYQQKQDAIAEKDRIALEENTQVRKEQKAQQAAADARDAARQDSIKQRLDSMAIVDRKLLGNQYSIMGQNASLSAKVDHKSALTRRTIREAVGKLPVQTIHPKEPQQEEKPKNLYEKFKDLFRHHSRATTDSLGHAYFRPDYSAPGDSARLPE